MTNSSSRLRGVIALVVFGTVTVPTVVWARVLVVTTSIQAAVNDAEPGDIVKVSPGIYHETVLVDQDNITIQGSRAAVIDATGFDHGIRVGTGELGIDANGFQTCPPISVHNFTIEGLTIQNAEDTGLRLIGVDGFRVTGGRYVDNTEYGPFPLCSRNGQIDFNHIEGARDAAIYVGQDDHVTVTNNHVRRSVLGIEVENSTNVVVRSNQLVGNTAGILVVVLPGLSRPLTDNVLIEGNVVLRNNFANPLPFDPSEPASLLPRGTGILNVGGDRVVIQRNVVIKNDSGGVTLSADPFALVLLDPRLDPFPDANEVRHNVILQNGKNLDPLRALTPGADITYLKDLFDLTTGEVLLEDPAPDNCFADNVFQTEFPDGITALFLCP